VGIFSAGVASALRSYFRSGQLVRREKKVLFALPFM
jgi:hypothetical protein